MNPDSTSDKTSGIILNNESELLEWINKTKSSQKKLVVASGCYDVIHFGHVSNLEAASDMGGSLLIGINSDESVKKLKGPNRPINKQEHRAKVLASLRCVSAVYVYEITKDFLKLVKPDIWVKGSDYTLDSLNQEELKAVTENGGEVRFARLVEGISTTHILSKI